MAKQKPEDLNSDVTFNGHSIDPEIQKKVDQYMDSDAADPTEVPKSETPEVTAPEVPPAASEETAPDAATAPLLPTEQLPDSLKDSKPVKSRSITVKDADNEPSLEEPGVPVEPVEAETETEDSTEDLVPEEPKAEALAAETDEESSAAEESEEAKTEILVDDAESEPEPLAPIDAESLAAPDFDEKPDFDGKTIADMEASSVPLDDPQTAQAIDEIIASDADQILAIEDEKKGAAAPVVVPDKKAKKAKSQNIFKKWLKTPLYRNATIVALIAGVIAAGVVPVSRYYLLNAAGVKVSASVRILDESTSLPLKNVELVVAGKSTKTDSDGNAKLEKIPLGYQTLTIKKPAFAELTRSVTLGWGSNPLGDFRLTPVGSQYTFKLTDFLSSKPVTKGELNYGESSAKFSEEGEAKITVPNVKEEEIEIEVSAENYRSEKVKISTVGKEEYALKLVPDKQHVFFSKRTGKADLYKSYVDGKNEEVILSATGIERDDSLGIAPHPSKNLAAFSSSRENVRNKDGFLLNTLQLIDLETKEVTKIAQSERIQIIDWASDRLVFVKIAQGASQADTKRHRLMSYDLESKTEQELASTNYFNDVLSVKGAIYYSPALYKVNGSVGLYKINPDGTNKKTIFQKEVWNLFRVSYDKISLSVAQDWYELNLATDAMVKVGGAPPVLKSRIYIESPNKESSLWIDERDGKTVLMKYNHGSQEDKPLQTQSGMRNPVRWLDDDHVVYRIANGQETADYVISLSGGEPKKIVDVTNSYGIDRWYYF